jgi:arabinose-5-phosphate isomerase
MSLAAAADHALVLDEIRRVLAVERRAIEELEARIDHQAARAVELLLHCRARVIVTGMGKAGLIARKIAATLASTGSPAVFLHPAEASHGDLGIVTADDVLLCLSNSGETEEVNNLLPAVKRFGVQIIALTGNLQSTLARFSDVALDVGVAEEADRLGVAPTASTTAMLAMGDALAMALMQQRGFTREQFALFHPGGSLGRQLLLRVCDLMHAGAELPRVSPNVSVREAICEMSRKGLGTTLVVDADGSLAGIFTDGDVRRLLERESAPLDGPISAAMVCTPKSIAAQALAVEALRQMQQHKIAVLPVLDDEGRPCGIIHLQDLIRARLA